MCGIIAIVSRRSGRALPGSLELTEPLARAAELLEGLDAGSVADALRDAANAVGSTDRLLRGSPGVRAMLADRALLASIENLTEGLSEQVDGIDRTFDRGERVGDEDTNAALIALKDAIWAVQRDRVRTAHAVEDLAGADAGRATVDGYLSIQQALSALDRLEVRGRDSAGIQVLVRGHGLDLREPALAAVLRAREDDLLFGAMAVRTPEGHLSFVYKAAAEIGELGDNTKALRAQVREDSLLRQALAGEGAEVIVLGHTRWASVGIISQHNAHPLESIEMERRDGPYVTAVLNGDVDNFADLKATQGLRIPTEITTDAKVIPTLTSRAIAGGTDVVDAFRMSVNDLDGSVAIAASVAMAPDRLLLALRGSGQALYIGVAEDRFIVASEPYGVVEEADSYLRLDGETPADPANAAATRGQVVVLDGAAAGTLAGLRRISYDGNELPIDASEFVTAEITTRDIDRGDHPHFLLKEISEAPTSFRKTLRGRLQEVDGALRVVLPPESFPDSVRASLRSGAIRHVLVIGQGTAAVAGQSLVAALGVLARPEAFDVRAALATELSGFNLRADMSDTLIVAVSQSGTTTDTNRTVDLARGRGAVVIAVVNRRNSDLTDKADGVVYTADGRDVEMSVASTKAFYSQIAACVLLASAIADEVGTAADVDADELLRSLRDLPDAMTATLALRDQLAVAARQLAPSRRYWAIVGNGVNRIAAQEIRIKLSELCYKSIACDATEDKKHIDLSAEPMILVCAAGLSGSTADDVAKEVAIYRAHKAAPIVIATEGDERFGAALQAVLVPPTHPTLAFVLSAMAGHLFGYEAAMAIDAQARPLRLARGAIEEAVSDPHSTLSGEQLLEQLRPALVPASTRFFEELRTGDYDGHLEASSAVRLASMFRYALGLMPLDGYTVEHGRQGTPSVVIEDLTDALTRAIDELTRPIDAIKHQAKTVTVGISRSDEGLLQVGLVKEVLATGAARDRLTYAALRTLTALDPLVSEVLGYTRYRIESALDGDEDATLDVIDRGGIGRELRSRTDDNPVLRGTKHRVATERSVLLAQGRSDGRTVLLVPEVRDQTTTGLTLLHVALRTDLGLNALRSVLQGYRGRYQALKDAVTETEPAFRDDLMTAVPVVELMTAPINDLADRWRS